MHPVQLEKPIRRGKQERRVRNVPLRIPYNKNPEWHIHSLVSEHIKKSEDMHQYIKIVSISIYFTN